MKKYKIGNRIITADSPVEAIKVSKILDSDVAKSIIKDYYLTQVGRRPYQYTAYGIDKMGFLREIGNYADRQRAINEAKRAKLTNYYDEVYVTYIGPDTQLKEKTIFTDSADKLANSEIDYLTKEEEHAVEDYRNAIAGTTNPKLLELYKHILDEELEHIKELEQANNVEDCSTKDANNDSEIIDLHTSYTTSDYAGLKDYMKQNGLKAYYMYFDKQSANKAEQVARLLQQLHFKTNIVRNNVHEFGQSFDGYIKVTDSKTKDWAPPYAIWVKKDGKWVIFGGSNTTNVDKRRFLNSGYEDVTVVENGKEPTDK